MKYQYLNLSVWLVFEHEYNYGEEKPSEHIKYIIEEGKLWSDPYLCVGGAERSYLILIHEFCLIFPEQVPHKEGEKEDPHEDYDREDWWEVVTFWSPF